jgi:polysaccharide biosynthesis transport protein
MELSAYLGIVRRWWFILVAAVVLAGLGGYVVASQQVRIYEAETRLLVGPINTDLNTQRASGQLALTYAQLVQTQRITEAVIVQLGLSMRPDELAQSVSAGASDLTRIVTIRASSPDPELAALIANTVADELGLLAATGGRPEGETLVIDLARAPLVPSSPRLPLITLLAAGAGLISALAMVILLELSWNVVRSRADISSLTGAPVLGTVPTRRARRANRSGSHLDNRSADSYRLLLANLETTLPKDELRRIAVAAVDAAAPAGIVATNLALQVPARGQRVALVDATHERNGIASLLGIRTPPDRRYRIPVHIVSVDGGRELVVFDEKFLPAEVEGAEEVLSALAEIAEAVVIATGSPQRSASALLWARAADAVILVTHGEARRKDVSAATDAIRMAGISIAGTVIGEERGHRKLGLPAVPSKIASLPRGWRSRYPDAGAPADVPGGRWQPPGEPRGRHG